MSIEFTCLQCGQKLRVGDEAAGKRAKCPKCGEINPIPEPHPPGVSEEVDVTVLPEVPSSAPGGSPFGVRPPRENPYIAPQLGYGFPGAATATGSPFGAGPILNVPTDVGSVLNYAIEVWKQNLGLLVGATVVVTVICYACAYGFAVVAAVLTTVVQHQGSPMIGSVASIVGNLASAAVQLYLTVGMSQIMLKLARRQRTDFSDLFNGASRFLPVLGVSILFGLMIVGGLLLLIIPAIIIGLMWWPCILLVIDDRSSVMDSFGVSREITRNNMGTTFLVWLVGMGIGVLGLLACCVGIFFAQPLVGMMFVVAYLMMSGQLPLQPQRFGDSLVL